MEEVQLKIDEVLPLEIWCQVAKKLSWTDAVSLRNSALRLRQSEAFSQAVLNTFPHDEYWKGINLQHFFEEVSPAFHRGVARFFKSPTVEVARVLQQEVGRIQLLHARADGVGLTTGQVRTTLKNIKTRFNRALTLFPEVKENVDERVQEATKFKQNVSTNHWNANAELIAKMLLIVLMIYVNSAYLFKHPKAGVRLLGIALSMMSVMPVAYPMLRDALFPQPREGNGSLLNAITQAEQKAAEKAEAEKLRIKKRN